MARWVNRLQCEGRDTELALNETTKSKQSRPLVFCYYVPRFFNNPQKCVFQGQGVRACTDDVHATQH